MPVRFAEASLVLARAGASTVAELAAARKPSLLVPFALAADDHQRKNAEALATTGAARMLLERDLTPESLLTQLTALLKDQPTLTTMSERVAPFARPNAVSEIAQLALSLT
jgi:UDP-N-acetylglucosamine--N-acetylmuramyl-(pentapeptide) pyrophosphoryl-undecaprenol N-acetylglucosamine transferase